MRRLPLLLTLTVACGAPDALSQDAEADITSAPPPRLDLGLTAPDAANLDAAPDAAPDAANLDAAPDIAPDAANLDAAPDAALTWRQPLRLLSLNLHCLKLEGTRFESNAARMGFIAEVVAAEGIQALALQEACVQGEVDALELLREALEARIGTPWRGAWAAAHVAWESTADEADEGLGFLIQGEIEPAWAHHYLNQGPLHRLALGVRLPPELGGFDLYTLHLDYNAQEARRLQALESAAAALLRRADAQIIIVGDLNSVEGSATHEGLLSMGFERLNGGLDPGGIDHALAHRAAGLKVSEARALFLNEDAVSDHPGLLIELHPDAPQPICRTEIRARFNAGFGHALSLRGEGGPLSWAAGLPLINVEAEVWAIALSELSQAFEYKLLLDDTAWQVGDDLIGVPCAINEASPIF
ncbi:endonuclease/exonuclease/phosphatase family protein [Myxococcota bacterium]|nr:endonuclease/exonuclease/phosphatase family protein [Myxococcota bacterium]